MNTRVTPKQIEQYQRNGYIILEDFLAPHELAEMTEAVMDTVDKMGRKKFLGEGNEEYREGSDAYYDNVFLQRINLWKDNDTIAGYFMNSEIGQMLCKLAGINGIRIWHDHTLQKRPWSNPTSWHLDCPNWSFHSRDSLSVWIALDEATIQNGCMYFLPGSHKTSAFNRNGNFGPQVGNLFDVYPEWRNIEAVPIQLKPGSASIHNGMIAHGAGPNMTPYPRRAMVCIYMPDGVKYNGNQNVLSREQVAMLKIGDPLEFEDQTPLIWSKQHDGR